MLFAQSESTNRILSTRGSHLQPLLSCKNRDFWSEVKRIRSQKVCPSIVVDSLSTADSIVEFFAHTFEDLYSCVSYSSENFKHINDDLNVLVDEFDYAAECVFHYCDMCNVVARLRNGKSDGYHD